MMMKKVLVLLLHSKIIKKSKKPRFRTLRFLKESLNQSKNNLNRLSNLKSSLLTQGFWKEHIKTWRRSKVDSKVRNYKRKSSNSMLLITLLQQLMIALMKMKNKITRTLQKKLKLRKLNKPSNSLKNKNPKRTKRNKNKISMSC